MDFKKIITSAALSAVLGASLYFLPPNPSTAEAQPKTHLGLEKIVYEIQPKINREDINHLSRCIVPVNVNELYKEAGEIREGGGTGSGILLGKNYLLTACHLINSGTYVDPRIATPSPPRKMIRSECNAIIDKTKYALEKVVEDTYWDFSLMKFKAVPVLTRNEEYKLVLGKSSELQYGDFVYVVGNGNNQGIDFRMTHITKPVEEDGFFCISQSNLAHGDSGGYVFAVKNGIPELVGMLNEIRGDIPYGYAIGIDPIIEKIKAYNPKIIEEWNLLRWNLLK